MANAILFLLGGFSVVLPDLLRDWWPVGAAIAAVLVARLLVVEAVGRLTVKSDIAAPPRERAVYIWSGLRGALTIVLALGLPAETPHRDRLIATAFGVELFTLLVQGLTLPLLIRMLGLAQPRHVDAAISSR